MNLPSWTVGLALLTVSLVACKGNAEKHDAPPPPPRPGSGVPASAAAKPVVKTPPGVKISFDTKNYTTKILVEGIEGASGELRCTGHVCVVDIPKLPEGTKAKVGANEVTVGPGGNLPTLELDLSERLVAASPKDVLVASFGPNDKNEPFDLAAKLELTFPDGVKVAADLPKVDMRSTLSQYLAASAREGKGVTLGKTDTSDKRGAILFFPIILAELVGDAKTVRDIDRVAIPQDLEKRPGGKKCSGYKAANEAGPGKELDLLLGDREVKIVERRTGKVLETKKFEAPKTCPTMAVGNDATSMPDPSAMTAWLKTKL